MAHTEKNYPLLDVQVIDKLKEAHLEIHHHDFLAGELILTKGAISEEIHIILSGQVRVFIEQERKVQLALLERAHFFGEMSCLTGDPISAHVEAVDSVKTISICRKGMMLLMDENAEFRMQIIESMVKRIQNSNERVLEEHKKSLLLLKHHETEELDRYGELIGDSPLIKNALKEIKEIACKQDHLLILGEPGTEKMSAARKIHEFSANKHYPFLVLNADELDLLTWSTKLQVAEGGTIVVANAEQLPRDMLNQMLETQQTRIILTATALPLRLATVQIPSLRERVDDIPLLAKHFAMKAGALDEETALSQDALRLLSLFPFLTNNVEELRDLINEAYILSEGRMIYGNHLRFGRTKKPGDRPKIGLALGSGSLRGIAHLGVLQVLEEEKIPVDMIAGTSAGSLIGGAYATGLSVKESSEIMANLTWGKFLRPTFPKRSFVQNTPMIKVIESYIGTHQIENLKTPFAAVAADTLTGDAHIIKTGSLAHAISASTAIPSIIRPVEFQGKRLIDGAVVHPVPAALVKSMGADIVIAVNVCPEKFTKGTTKHFIDSLLNTIDMMSAKMVREELQLADVILRPDLGFNQISFKDTPFCMDAGIAITRENLHKIQQKITMY